MSRTLVTGATGFVGSNLVAHLCKQGWDVRCLVRSSARAAHLEQLGAELALGALNDTASLASAAKDTDVVFHLAGRIRALHSQQFTEDNVEGTRNVVEACAAQPRSPVVVYVSSIAAGGPSLPGAPRRESDKDEPVSNYGRSKLAAERAAVARADEVPLSILRPPIVFGPADRASLAIFRSVQRTRLHLVPGLRRFPVSIIHVADLCDALVRIAEHGERVTPLHEGNSNTSTGIYYAAAERTVTYGELGKLAARAVGCGAIALPAPKFFFWLVGGTAEAVGRLRRSASILNLDKVREALAPGWECSDEKIRRQLGYQPAEPLEKRFADTAAWYREHGWL